MTEEQHQVNESASKIRLTTKLVRGSGTRDSDTIKVKVRGDDPDEVVEKLDDTLELLEFTAEDVRRMQPTEPP